MVRFWRLIKCFLTRLIHDSEKLGSYTKVYKNNVSFRNPQLHLWNQGLEDEQETSAVPDASCPSPNSTIIYWFLSGTHSYIDGTKDWKTTRKCLRFQMLHVPLKVLQ